MSDREGEWHDRLQEATAKWVEAVLAEYEGAADHWLTQVHARGHFSGWSELEIVNLARGLKKNNKDYPPWPMQ